jgi:hypothetical protein
MCWLFVWFRNRYRRKVVRVRMIIDFNTNTVQGFHLLFENSEGVALPQPADTKVLWEVETLEGDNAGTIVVDDTDDTKATATLGSSIGDKGVIRASLVNLDDSPFLVDGQPLFDESDEFDITEDLANKVVKMEVLFDSPSSV